MSIKYQRFDFIIIKEDEFRRLDVFLVNKLKNYSRGFIQKQIEKELVFVNTKINKSNYKLKENDQVYILIEEADKQSVMPQDINLNIVFEDDDLLVINKPRNMVVHPAPGHFENTLVNALLFYCKHNLSYYGENTRPGIVHRLDKDTSGLLVVAKNNETHEHLKKQLQVHSMTRVYNAVIFGNLKNDEGIIDRPLGRNERNRKNRCVDYENGKQAITYYKVLNTYKEYSLVEANLKTGRTHQIRVHFSSIGHPIVGDLQYGLKKQPIKTKGQILHSKTIGFEHPKTGEFLIFDSDLPDYFKDIVKIIDVL